MSPTPDIERLTREHLEAVGALRVEIEARVPDPGKIARIEKSLDGIEDRIAGLETRARRPGGGRRAEPVSPERKAFATFVKKGSEGLGPEEIKVLSVADDAAGGYWAPSEFVGEIIKGVTEFSPIRALARVRQTAASTVEIPRRTGVFSAAWVDELEARSETTGLAFGLEEIPTHELTADVRLSTKLLEDAAVDMEAELNMEFAERFGVAEGAAFVSGNGVKRPEGFLDHSDVATTNSGSAASIADANGQANGLIDLFHGLKDAYARNGTWVANRTTIGAIRKLKDGQNNYIWQPGVAGVTPNTILGRAYVEATDMPAVAANAKAVAFGDWRRAYTIVDRIVMSVLRDPYTLASQGQVKFVARRRVGGQVVLAEALRTLTIAA